MFLWLLGDCDEEEGGACPVESAVAFSLTMRLAIKVLLLVTFCNKLCMFGSSEGESDDLMVGL